MVLDEIDDETFDAAVLDPPFGIGYTYNGKPEKARTPEEYWKWFEPIYRKTVSKIKPGGFISVWQTQLYFKHFWTWYGDNIHVYAGCKNFVQLRNTPINYGYDPIIMFYKDGAKPLVPVNKRRSIDYFVADTAHFGYRPHPCPRSLDQCEEIIKNFVIEGGSVLDPFAGWTTIGIACLRNGRKYTGIEIDEKYYEASKIRIERESAITTLDSFWGDQA